MDYEMGFDLVLRVKGKRIIDGSKAKVLKAIMEEGELRKAARSLSTNETRLRKRLDDLKDNEGRTLVVIAGERTSLTEAGRKVLEIYEDRTRFILEQVEHRYRNPLLTVDGIVLMEGGVVVVRRGRPPFEGKLALPGGIVEYGETVEEAVVREVEEETGLRTVPERLVALRSNPERDPRGHFVSAVYSMKVVGGRLRSGDDASGVTIMPCDPLPDLAFDHSDILRDFLADETAGSNCRR
jgi:8-oxo-dGTP diphosphatase